MRSAILLKELEDRRRIIRGASVSVDDMTMCRTIGHSWDFAGAHSGHREPHLGGFYFIVDCARCTTERRDIITYSGELMKRGRTYIYPRGYSDVEAMTRAELRSLLIKRIRAEHRTKRVAGRPGRAMRPPTKVGTRGRS